MSIVRNFNLYLNAGNGSAPYINANQYDSGEQWIFTLYKEDGTKYTPSTGAIVGIKADNRGIINTGTVDADGRVVINETQQMTAAAGIAIFELQIDNGTHGTANFIVAVERKPTDDAVMSDSDLSLIQEAIDSAEVIVEVIGDGDPSEVIGEHVDAWLDNHPEATTTVEDGAITEAKLNDSVKTGVFEDMTVGTSLAVMNDEGVTDNLAYKFRQTGGDAVRELDEIHGGTIAWNQLVATGATSVTVQSGHKYLSKVNGVQTIGASTGSAISINDASADNVFDLTAMFGTTVADAIYAMEQSSAGSGVAYFRSLFPNAYYAYNSGELVSVEGLSSHDTVGFNLFDGDNFTAYYGYLRQYSADAYQWRMSQDSRSVVIKCLPNTTYCVYMNGLTPAILRVGATAESTLPQPNSGDWEIPIEKAFASSTSGRVTYTTGANAKWLIVQSNVAYVNDLVRNNLCINISDPSKNGTYKPYQKHTYPLDSTLTLRGVPKWNNGLYFDGDIYRHDGSVSRRYGIVDLGTLDWATGTYAFYATPSSMKPYTKSVIAQNYTFVDTTSSANLTAGQFTTGAGEGKSIWFHKGSYADATAFKSAMSGVYLVYELATPTAETADPYQQYQICDGKGTEEYISETVTPVGHNTFYPVDIVAKVNKLPSDFSTLIAPTEKGFTATRNYTVNDLVIVNDTLYKVTANISTGSAITPNSNVQQTTLGALIKALS